MNKLPIQPDTISRLFDAVYPSFAMLAGMELDLFTPLNDGPLSLEQIAEAINVQAVKLRPLLYALVIAGLLTVEDDLFSNTVEVNHFLVRGKHAFLGELQELTSGNWRRILNTAGTIRTGGPLEIYDYHSTMDELVALFRGLYPGTLLDAQRLLEQYDFSTYSTLLDVGGGSGGLAIALTQANPHLTATIIDLPSIIPIAQKFVKEANASDQIEFLVADVVQEAPTGSYDVIVARHLIQVLSASDSRALLRNLASVLKPGGIIHLIGWVLDDSRVSPEKTVGYNLILLNAYQDGQAYTEKEYRDWLSEAGFENIERVRMTDGASIVTACKSL